MSRKTIQLLVVALLSWASAARAETHTYALVIGANQGGEGQPTLRYAAEDAKHFAELLIELGRAPREAVRLLLQPTPAALTQALTELRGALAAHARAGERSKLLFYYSGHARARSLSLGGAELPLDALRAQLLTLPSTLTVVVLDACQSGSFSGVKGAVPAADFAQSSISDLHNEGVAVMASSTAAELSQESPELGASYFTHHLLTGMRGAADRNRDGSVALDEAYAYAYQNTLSSTVRTRVGSQHATLEIALKGHGQVPLTYTFDADAQLLLPVGVDGRIVVQQQGRGAVVAELTKAGRVALPIALPHGSYEVLVRATGEAAVRSCALHLLQRAVYTLDTRGCPLVTPPALLAQKGGQSEPFERWFVELGALRRFAHADGYTDTLADFRFRDVGDFVVADDAGSFMPQLAAGLGLSAHWSLSASLGGLQKRAFERRLKAPGEPDDVVEFAWRTWSLVPGARVRLPLSSERFVPFAELGLGLGLSRAAYQPQGGAAEVDFQFGPVLRASLGATCQLFWRLGVVLSAGYDYAPVLENELGQTRDDGGFYVGFALRLRGLTQARFYAE